jgi:prepilin-type N-terminal cleavage/methylation domain-containing protein
MHDLASRRSIKPQSNRLAVVPYHLIRGGLTPAFLPRMISRFQRGFTLIEVLVAVVLLTVGVMALVGSSAMVSRMIGRGRGSTVAVQVATARLERLRRIAASTMPRCTSPQFVSDSTTTSGISERWIVEPAAGLSRGVSVILAYRDPRGLVRDTLRTTVLCG